MLDTFSFSVIEWEDYPENCEDFYNRLKAFEMNIETDLKNIILTNLETKGILWKKTLSSIDDEIEKSW